MSEGSLPLIRATTVLPFCERVESAGLDLDDLLERSGLSRAALQVDDVYLPAPVIYGFCERCADILGNPHLGVEIGLNPDIRSWPPVRGALMNSSSLVEFLAHYLFHIQLFSTSTRYSLDMGPDVAWLRQDRGFRPAEAPAQIDALGVGTFVSIFRAALGDRWSGTKMVFRVCRPDAARVHGTGSVTLTPGDTGGLACSFPSRWLLEPMRTVSTKPSVEESARAGLVPPRDIVVALRSSILAQIHDPDLDVARLVKQMGLNRRAAQKLLRERGSGFRELLDELRREQAIQKIASGRYSVKGTAQALGYSDAANFTRAFRRWTGMSPSAFLRQRTPSEHGVPEARPDDSSTSARSAGKRLKRLHDRVAEE